MSHEEHMSIMALGPLLHLSEHGGDLISLLEAVRQREVVVGIDDQDPATHTHHGSRGYVEDALYSRGSGTPVVHEEEVVTEPALSMVPFFGSHPLTITIKERTLHELLGKLHDVQLRRLLKTTEDSLVSNALSEVETKLIHEVTLTAGRESSNNSNHARWYLNELIKRGQSGSGTTQLTVVIEVEDCPTKYISTMETYGRYGLAILKLTDKVFSSFCIQSFTGILMIFQINQPDLGTADPADDLFLESIPRTIVVGIKYYSGSRFKFTLGSPDVGELPIILWCYLAISDLGRSTIGDGNDSDIVGDTTADPSQSIKLSFTDQKIVSLDIRIDIVKIFTDILLGKPLLLICGSPLDCIDQVSVTIRESDSRNGLPIEAIGASDNMRINNRVCDVSAPQIFYCRLVVITGNIGNWCGDHRDSLKGPLPVINPPSTDITVMAMVLNPLVVNFN